MPKRCIQTTRNQERVLQVQGHKAFFRLALESARSQSLNSIGANLLIKLPIVLGGVVITALLDSRAQSNYVSLQAVWQARLKLQQKQNPYLLRVANRELMLAELEITYKVLSVPLQIQNHLEQLDLDAFGIATYNVILGLL
jgi:hypothetical protein